MTTKANFARDVQGYNTYLLQYCNNIYDVALTANTDTTLTVPSDARNYLAIFQPSSGATFYVAVGTAAVVPSGSTFSQTHSECNSPGLAVTAGQVLHFITADVGDTLTVKFYDVTVA